MTDLFIYDLKEKHTSEDTDEAIRESARRLGKTVAVSRSPLGQPLLDTGFVSVSHAEEVLLIALSDAPVGVDAERADKAENIFEKIARSYFSEKEQAFVFDGSENAHTRFLRLWTRKEARVKAAGRGLAALAEADALEENFASVRLDDYAVSIFPAASVTVHDERGKFDCGGGTTARFLPSYPGRLEAFLRAAEEDGVTVRTRRLGTRTLYFLSDGTRLWEDGGVLRVFHDAVPARDVTVEIEGCEPVTAYVSGSSDRIFYLRLQDGSFLMVDGGWPVIPSMKQVILELWNELHALCGLDVIPVRLWLVTHPHGDHCHLLEHVHECGLDHLFAVERIAYQFPAPENVEENQWDKPEYLVKMEQRFRLWPGVTLLRLFTGRRLTLGNTAVDVLHTPEESYPTRIRNLNDTSLLLRVTAGGKRVLWTGDLSPTVADRAAALLGDELKCDFLQVPHHGTPGGGSRAFFAACAAPVQLWNTAEEPFKTNWYEKNELARRLYDEENVTRYFGGTFMALPMEE